MGILHLIPTPNAFPDRRSLKRSHTEVKQTDFARYGLELGMLEENREKILVRIMCSGWPFRAMGAAVRNWRVVVIIIKNRYWYREIFSMLSNAIIIEYQEGKNVLTGELYKVHLWLSDFNPPRKLKFGLGSWDVIVNSRQARQLPTS